MRLNDDLYVLSIAREGQAAPLNLSLILDPVAGPALVDTGLPGMAGTIAAALGEAGVTVEQLTRLIITHQDLDHVGSLGDLKAASGASVLAHAIEAPYIDGRSDLVKLPMLRSRPELAPVLAQFRPTAVDQLLEDGDRLDLAGGVRVVFTPGHTPGHSCLYLERSRTLIAGDALTAREGRLHGPNPPVTQEMAEAARSVQKLAALDVDAIVCYHGGVVRDDAAVQLRRVADELASGA
jgi:glyoxylase-like metal-dependent hydrolase (beta-lactamase superfamily II)